MRPKAPQKVTITTNQAGEVGHYTIGGTYNTADNVMDITLKRVDGKAVSTSKTIKEGTFSIDWNISNLTPADYKVQVYASNTIGDSEPIELTITLTQQMIDGTTPEA